MPGTPGSWKKDPKLARVGADALAIRVIGPVDKIELPKVGPLDPSGTESLHVLDGHREDRFGVAGRGGSL